MLIRAFATVTVLGGILSGYGANTVNLAWNASADSTVAGYKIYYGTNASSLSTGSSIDAGANLSATIANLGPGTYYFGAVSYNSSRVESDLSNITSTNFVDAPAIVAQSTSVTCAYGATTNLSVTATGSSLSYQWISNGVAMVNAGNVSGVASSALTFTSAVSANAGSYRVVVSNPAGTTTSAVMTLTVLNPPTVTSQPSSLTRNTGTTATFSITAGGAPALSYKWFKNGTAMADGGNVFGSASASLTVSSLSTGDAATYQCVVANSYGSATSASAMLTVITPAAIASQPASQTLNAGSIAVFNVGASGTAPLTYSWTKNGTPLGNSATIFGATTASLTISSVATTDTGSYAAIVSNAGGTVSSSAATLGVIAAPVITSQPQSQTTNANSSAVFSVIAQSAQSMNYQWIKNGSAIVNSPNMLGTTTPTLTISSVQLADGGSYKCIITNSAGTTSSSMATLTVIAGPAITAQPSSQTLNSGATAIFNVAATGSGTLVYAWSKNGVPMADGGNVLGSASSSLTVSGVSGADAASYQCTVTNSSGSATSAAATLTVVNGPLITSQPVSATANAGSAASFSITVQGSQPMTYQWLFNSTPVAGATSATLALSNVQAANAGSYSCTVSNSAGNAASSIATLTVITGPSITSQPASATVNAGNGASFSVTAQGSQPLTYQWLFNAAPIAGANSSTLALSNVQSANAGSYSCSVSNAAGKVVSSPASLTVIIGPTIGSQPVSATVNAGDSASFSVLAQGSQPLTYQWLFNAAPIAGATSSTLALTSVQSANAGGYSCTVSNAAGNVVSSAATLTVVTGPSITSQPVSATVNTGSSASFSISAQGSQPLTYQWMFNAAPIAGATSSTLALSNVQSANGGSYSCTVSNQAGNVLSSVATLTVITGPSITAQPTSATTAPGSAASFSVAAQGSQPLVYQWYFNASPIAGATGATILLNNAQSANAGTYSCTVSNQAGSVTSSTATLTVSATTTITSQPTNQILNACDTLTLAVAVSGSMTPAFQWVHNGASIVGATNATLSVNGVNGNDAGTYYVQVTGDHVVTSSNAIVTVNDPTFLSQPGDNCVSVNSTNVFVAQACGASLSYQWYFIPSGSTSASAIAGATSASLTVGPATTKDVGQYFCIVTNNFGSITSRSASLGVEVPPTINTQPLNIVTVAGASVTFSIDASASAPLTFQWTKNGKNISGATASNFTLAAAQQNDSGTYQCYVGTTLCQSTALSSSSYGHLTVNKPKPNSKFTSPTSNTQFTTTSAESIGNVSGSSQQITMSGVASDTGRVSDVTVTRTFPTSAPLTIHPALVGSPTLYHWTNLVALVPGTNVFDAVVTDAAGLSATNTVAVFLRATSVLHIDTAGAGTTTPLAPFNFGTPTNDAVLDIGRNYRVSAKPAVGNVFSNWVDGSGTELSTSATLVFRMQSNLQLTANFVTNPVVANQASGSYNGLFYETNEVRVKSAGAIFNLTVRSDARFSGLMKLDGRSYPLSGSFDVQGNVTENIVRPGNTVVTVAMHLDYAAKQITGTISSPSPDAWSSELMMDIAPYSNANRFQNSARYTLAVPPGQGAPAFSPGGFGYGFVTNTPAGVISFMGTLADGTPVSQTVPISKQGYWPFYIPLYGNRGLIQGWLNFSSGSPGGNVSWIRPAGRLTATYTNGFTNTVTLFGSPYIPRTPSLTPADSSLDVGYPLLTFAYAVSNNNAIVTLPGGPTNYMAGSISAPVGSVTLSYRPTGGSHNLTAHGAVLQWNNGAYGFVISNAISAPLHLH